MNAIILAAGEGTRLKRYTSDLPKGMLPFQGTPLIGHQLTCLRQAGIDRIAVVRGYRGACIAFPQVHYFENAQWACTNMVHSLLCAREWFSEAAVVSYADIVYTPGVLRAVLECRADFAVAVDVDWQRYWHRRYGRTDVDTESLQLDPAGRITGLGRPQAAVEKIDGRFVGLMKFSPAAFAQIERLCAEAADRVHAEPWQQSGQPFARAYMTDLLQALIERGARIQAVMIRGGWLEFDTNEDYEVQAGWAVEGGP